MTAAKVDAKSLGIVQAVIGVVIFMFGFATKYFDDFVCVYSGIMYWGSFCFIISGVLAAVTVDHRHYRLVTLALGSNLISAVVAFVALIMYSVDLVRVNKAIPPGLSEGVPNITWYFLGTFKVLLVLSIFEIGMSMWTFVLIWKARDSTEATVSVS